jgi:hypothetical protein
MKSLSLSRSAVIAASAALAAIGSAGIAQAISSNIFQYSTPQTGYLSLGPQAFAPASKGDAAHYTIEVPFWIQKDAGALGLCMVAPVNLPEGARITSLKAWARADADLAVQLVLHRTNLAVDAPANDMVELLSHDTSQTRFGMTAVVPNDAIAIVNNEHYSYGVEVCIDSTASVFYSARITYVYRNAGG